MKTNYKQTMIVLAPPPANFFIHLLSLCCGDFAVEEENTTIRVNRNLISFLISQTKTILSPIHDCSITEKYES